MARFHVHSLPDGTLVLDLQTDLIDTGTRVVAPLLPITRALTPITRLEPVFEIAGARLALHTAEMAAVPEALLSREPVADLSAEDYVIRSAIDMVFSGF